MQPKYFKENSVDFCVYPCQRGTRGKLVAMWGVFFFFFKKIKKKKEEKELPRRAIKAFLLYAAVLVMMQFLGHIVT